MKAKVLDIEGRKVREIQLPACFDSGIRNDIIHKVFQASLSKQPYAPNILAGMRHSASGKIRHRRRKWKTAYGYGIARIPRKIHTRRGSRFSWVGATVASARGGRQAHPPKILSMLNKKKINKKEKRKALFAAIAATASVDALRGRYARLADSQDKKIQLELPLVLDSRIAGLSIKELKNLVKKLLDSMADIAEREKNQRAGKGKMRGRRYKQSRGMLIVTASDEKLKCKYFEAINAKKLGINELAPGGMPGRLVFYTEKAVSELDKRFSEKEDKK